MVLQVSDNAFKVILINCNYHMKWFINLPEMATEEQKVLALFEYADSITRKQAKTELAVS